MKKMTSLLLCAAMLLSLAMPVHAEEGDGGTPSEATEHIHDWSQSVVTTPADCTNEGVETSTCDCGEIKKVTIGATGHSWTEEIITAAGCTTDGEKKKTCSKCNATETSPVPKTDHSWTEEIVTAAGCTTDGEKKKTCSRCNATEMVAVSKLGHDWEEQIITAAECTTDGETLKSCKRCDATETVTVPKTGHSFPNTWSTTVEGHSRECSECHVTDSGSHSFKSETVKEATCAKEGSRKKVCTVCNYEVLEVIAKLKTHTYDNDCDPECNVCKEEREVEHTFTKTWSHDAKTHWYECTKCEEKKDEANHIPGPAASEEYAQVCLTCNRVITPKKEHVHSYGTEWTSDEVGHWHACATCKEEKEYSDHRYDDDCDESCNICGYERSDGHKYGDDSWQTTNFEHWNVCTLCGKERLHEKHVPGEEATEKAPQLCTLCGFELAPILDHDHDFGNKWHQDEQNHWQECDCGELSVPEAHVWNEGKKNRNDTITYTCEICGGEKTEQAPASGFSWVLVILIVLALACLAGIIVLLILLKKGSFSEDASDDDDDFDDGSFTRSSFAVNSFDGIDLDSPKEEKQDDEEKMIDDFFASLGEDL